MLTLYKKEISGFLHSFLGYLIIAIFLLVMGLFLWVFPLVSTNIFEYGFASMESLFIHAPIVFLFLIPAITMRFFADEHKSGTIEVLMTKPLTDLQVVLAKYFAALTLVIISLIPTLIYFFSVYQLGLPKGNIDTGEMWGSYIGLVFLAASFVAIGVFSSSLTNNQIISFILATVLSGFLYFGFELIYSFDLFSSMDLFIKALGINEHYTSMSRGVIDTRDMIYFLTLIALFIFLTKISLESRKW